MGSRDRFVKLVKQPTPHFSTKLIAMGRRDDRCPKQGLLGQVECDLVSCLPYSASLQQNSISSPLILKSEPILT